MIRKNVTFDDTDNKIGFDSKINTPMVEAKSMASDDHDRPSTPSQAQSQSQFKKRKADTAPEVVNKKLERHTIVELKIDNDKSVFDGIVKNKPSQRQVSSNVKVNKDSIDFVFIFLKTYDILLNKENNNNNN